MDTRYILIDDEDNKDQDLLVEAKTHIEAIVLWQLYFNLDPDESPRKWFNIPPLTGVSRAVRWHDPAIDLGAQSFDVTGDDMEAVAAMRAKLKARAE